MSDSESSSSVAVSQHDSPSSSSASESSDSSVASSSSTSSSVGFTDENEKSSSEDGTSEIKKEIGGRRQMKKQTRTLASPSKSQGEDSESSSSATSDSDTVATEADPVAPPGLTRKDSKRFVLQIDNEESDSSESGSVSVATSESDTVATEAVQPPLTKYFPKGDLPGPEKAVVDEHEDSESSESVSSAATSESDTVATEVIQLPVGHAAPIEQHHGSESSVATSESDTVITEVMPKIASKIATISKDSDPSESSSADTSESDTVVTECIERSKSPPKKRVSVEAKVLETSKKLQPAANKVTIRKEVKDDDSEATSESDTVATELPVDTKTSTKNNDGDLESDDSSASSESESKVSESDEEDDNDSEENDTDDSESTSESETVATEITKIKEPHTMVSAAKAEKSEIPTDTSGSPTTSLKDPSGEHIKVKMTRNDDISPSGASTKSLESSEAANICKSSSTKLSAAISSPTGSKKSKALKPGSKKSTTVEPEQVDAKANGKRPGIVSEENSDRPKQKAKDNKAERGLGSFLEPKSEVTGADAASIDVKSLGEISAFTEDSAVKKLGQTTDVNSQSTSDIDEEELKKHLDSQSSLALDSDIEETEKCVSDVNDCNVQVDSTVHKQQTQSTDPKPNANLPDVGKIDISKEKLLDSGSKRDDHPKKSGMFSSFKKSLRFGQKRSSQTKPSTLSDASGGAKDKNGLSTSGLKAESTHLESDAGTNQITVNETLHDAQNKLASETTILKNSESEKDPSSPSSNHLLSKTEYINTLTGSNTRASNPTDSSKKKIFGIFRKGNKNQKKDDHSRDPLKSQPVLVVPSTSEVDNFPGSALLEECESTIEKMDDTKSFIEVTESDNQTGNNIISEVGTEAAQYNYTNLSNQCNLNSQRSGQGDVTVSVVGGDETSSSEKLNEKCEEVSETVFEKSRDMTNPGKLEANKTASLAEEHSGTESVNSEAASSSHDDKSEADFSKLSKESAVSLSQDGSEDISDTNEASKSIQGDRDDTSSSADASISSDGSQDVKIALDASHNEEATVSDSEESASDDESEAASDTLEASLNEEATVSDSEENASDDESEAASVTLEESHNEEATVSDSEENASDDESKAASVTLEESHNEEATVSQSEEASVSDDDESQSKEESYSEEATTSDHGESHSEEVTVSDHDESLSEEGTVSDNREKSPEEDRSSHNGSAVSNESEHSESQESTVSNNTMDDSMEEHDLVDFVGISSDIVSVSPSCKSRLKVCEDKDTHAKNLLEVHSLDSDDEPVEDIAIDQLFTGFTVTTESSDDETTKNAIEVTSIKNADDDDDPAKNVSGVNASDDRLTFLNKDETRAKGLLGFFGIRRQDSSENLKEKVDPSLTKNRLHDKKENLAYDVEEIKDSVPFLNHFATTEASETGIRDTFAQDPSVRFNTGAYDHIKYSKEDLFSIADKTVVNDSEVCLIIDEEVESQDEEAGQGDLCSSSKRKATSVDRSFGDKLWPFYSQKGKNSVNTPVKKIESTFLAQKPPTKDWGAPMGGDMPNQKYEIDDVAVLNEKFPSKKSKDWTVWSMATKPKVLRKESDSNPVEFEKYSSLIKMQKTWKDGITCTSKLRGNEPNHRKNLSSYIDHTSPTKNYSGQVAAESHSKPVSSALQTRSLENTPIGTANQWSIQSKEPKRNIIPDDRFDIEKGAKYKHSNQKFQSPVIEKRSRSDEHGDIESSYSKRSQEEFQPDDTSSGMSTKKALRPCTRFVAIILLAMVGVGAGIGIALWLAGGQSEKGNDRENGNEATQAPSIDHVVSLLICSHLDDCEALNNSNTPQGMAFKWLIDRTKNPNLQSYSDYKTISRYALATFFYSTNGDNWIDNTYWLEEEDECNWFGTECDGVGEIVALEMNLNNVDGNLASDIGLLVSLGSLSLQNPIESDPLIHGSLKSFIGSLSALTSLVISGNDLSDSGIPSEIESLTLLESLDLHSNIIGGDIPISFAALSNLKILDLSQNKLTGALPTDFAKNANILLELNLESNIFTSFPSIVGGLSSLLTLSLRDNELIRFPTSIASLQSLKTLDLSKNRFGGPLPTELGSLSNLIELRLSNNDFEGTIPTELANILGLSDILDLSSNALTGPIPFELGRLVRLKQVFLNSNKLSSTIPSELVRLNQLNVLRIDDNMITGEVPALFCTMLENSLTVPVTYADCGKMTNAETCFTFCCTEMFGCICRFEVSDPLRCVKRSSL